MTVYFSFINLFQLFSVVFIENHSGISYHLGKLGSVSDCQGFEHKTAEHTQTAINQFYSIRRTPKLTGGMSNVLEYDITIIIEDPFQSISSMNTGAAGTTTIRFSRYKNS